MELNEKTTTAVLEWYDEKWNLPGLLRKKIPLTPETSLTTGRYPWARETGDEIMKDYFNRFPVDDSGFDFFRYWPPETGMWPHCLRPRALRVEIKAPEPLTISMLIESAKAGRWLY
ncbi:DUF1493 family protein [Cronobacter turicensis]|nr:DUF1493 family protein [Cronobacter turicensis]ELY4384836.1 DUF1493 family protein [Cronobacter turicensis]ELY6269953.1 DUF1493 family protein [Cronobacter turicensis]